MFCIFFQSFPIHLLSREENNDLLKALGFYRKEKEDDEVPDSYKSGPYVRNETEMDRMYAIIQEKKQEEATKAKSDETKQKRDKSHEEEKYLKKENEPVKDDL